MPIWPVITRNWDKWSCWLFSCGSALRFMWRTKYSLSCFLSACCLMLTELLLSQVKQGFQHGWPTHPEYTNQVKSSALKGGVGCCGFWGFFPSSLFVCFNTNLFFFFYRLDFIWIQSNGIFFICRMEHLFYSQVCLLFHFHSGRGCLWTVCRNILVEVLHASILGLTKFGVLMIVIPAC